MIPNSDIPAVLEIVSVRKAQAGVRPPVIIPLPDLNREK